MMRWVEVVSGDVVQVSTMTSDPTVLFPTTGQWVEAPNSVWVGWTYSGGVFTGPNGESAVEITTSEPRFLLTGAEWISLFTDDEWAWIKAQRGAATTAGKALDKMMDAIRWTDSVNVSASSMDPFYTWLLNNGLPGGQTRIDELRAGI